MRRWGGVAGEGRGWVRLGRTSNERKTGDPSNPTLPTRRPPLPPPHNGRVIRTLISAPYPRLRKGEAAANSCVEGGRREEEEEEEEEEDGAKEKEILPVFSCDLKTLLLLIAECTSA